MAGVPHHAASAYVQKLLDQGFKVAICEQMADPSKVKGIVPREVVRVATPGIAYDDAGLEPRRNHYLVAVERGTDAAGAFGVAALDLSTGELAACEAPDVTSVLSELVRLDPREVLVGPGAGDAIKPLADVHTRVVVRAVVAAADRRGRRRGPRRAARRGRSAGVVSVHRGPSRGGAVPRHGARLRGEEAAPGVASRLLRAGRNARPRRGDADAPGARAVGRRQRAGVTARRDRRDDDRTRRARRFAVAFSRRSRPSPRFAAASTRSSSSSRTRRCAARCVQGLADVGDVERLAMKLALDRATPRDLVALRRSLAALPSIADALARCPDPSARDALGVAPGEAVGRRVRRPRALSWREPSATTLPRARATAASCATVSTRRSTRRASSRAADRGSSSSSRASSARQRRFRA